MDVRRRVAGGGVWSYGAPMVWLLALLLAAPGADATADALTGWMLCVRTAAATAGRLSLQPAPDLATAVLVRCRALEDNYVDQARVTIARSVAGVAFDVDGEAESWRRRQRERLRDDAIAGIVAARDESTGRR